jgi:hypothetical protein
VDGLAAGVDMPMLGLGIERVDRPSFLDCFFGAQLKDLRGAPGVAIA